MRHRGPFSRSRCALREGTPTQASPPAPALHCIFCPQGVMQDERLLIIHTKTVPPPHPHGALTHQAPAANAAHGVPSPSAVQGVLRPRGTHGDTQELPGHGQVPGKPPGSRESPDFAASLAEHTALAPTRCHPPRRGTQGHPAQREPKGQREPWAVSTQAAPTTWMGTAPRQDGDTGVPLPHPGSATHAWGTLEHPPVPPRAVPHTWGTPVTTTLPWGMLPLHTGHPERHLPVWPPPRRAPRAHLPRPGVA